MIRCPPPSLLQSLLHNNAVIPSPNEEPVRRRYWTIRNAYFESIGSAYLREEFAIHEFWCFFLVLPLLRLLLGPGRGFRNRIESLSRFEVGFGLLLHFLDTLLKLRKKHQLFG